MLALEIVDIVVPCPGPGLFAGSQPPAGLFSWLRWPEALLSFRVLGVVLRGDAVERAIPI